ncbi:MAG: HAMP domain-containing sensor histidine kinase [candidate division KSB1 bacterium]|nr:HAMP domain-containing sensor histidine kinase [candidate division KSB1 bacterium]
MRQDKFNDRLYLLESGQLDGYHELAGERIRLFTVEPDMFVGVHSFFSSTFKSGATVLARKPSVLRFLTFDSIDQDKLVHQFYQDFMPVVVHELFSRTLNLQQAALDKHETLNQLIMHEKLASLGQMASGIAHELNNALSVLSRNTKWLCSKFQDIVTVEGEREKNLLYNALENGRALSTRDTRQLYKQLEKNTDYDRQSIQHLSEMNIKIDESDNEHITPNTIKNLYFKWQLATTLHDMSVSANQASQVIKSMRSLGSEPRKKLNKVSIRETINEALTLIYPQCKHIDLHIDIETDIEIQANPSELVQVWTNLLTNACQSLSHAETVKPEIYIHSFKRDSNAFIEITDNGPGIPKELIPHIFEPHVTTKVDGLSFGLGLGLSIVEKLLSYCNGTIRVDSKPGKTTFSVKIAL